jgi:hypothetical protein
MIDIKKYNKNLSKWRKLQKTGEAEASSLDLDSEAKIAKSANFRTKRIY